MRARLSRLLTSVAVLTLSVSAAAEKPVVNAGPAITAYYSQQALILPRTLLKRGLHTVGAMDLQRLITEIQTVHWFDVQNVFFAGSGSRRASAVNLIKDHQVFMNRISWQQSPPDVRNVLSLHEALEALGYNDDEYEISLSFWMSAHGFSKDKSFKRLDPRLRRSQTPTRFEAENGTVTGVGSGGDEYELQVKLDLLKYSKQCRQRPDFVLHRLRVFVSTPNPPALGEIEVRPRRSEVNLGLTAFRILLTPPKDLSRQIEARLKEMHVFR